jgi:eukaryotic-like serine/threonine-protein kinase
MSSRPLPKPEQSAPAPRELSRWRMGEVELDESTLELRVRGEPVAIERKPLELLMWLLRRPGEVVTKEELFDALWVGRVVTESVLTKCVAKLRQALGDEGVVALKTVHGYGYRLVAPVERLAVQLAAPAAAAPPLQPGDRPPLRPLWRLVRRFGASPGPTWLAAHDKTGEQRVFKFALDAAGLSRLKREITIHRLLRETLGPRDDLVRVLDWNLEEAPCFVEFEHSALGNLDEWLAGQGGVAAVPLAQRTEWVAQAAEAVAAAHSAGVLHKDIKPSNLLLDQGADGRLQLRVADFGSGRLLGDDRLQALQITQLGFTRSEAEAGDGTSGTWAYLAPELVAGQPATVRSDVFALGVLLYQLAVGDLRRPLAPGWERELDDPLLREDVAACCDQDPARRLGDAALLAQRLRDREGRLAAAAEREQAQAAMLASRQALDRARARRGWLLGLAGLSAAAALGLAVMLLQVHQARDTADRHAAAARAVSDFLVKDLIAAANPLIAGMPGVTVRQVLDTAAAQIDSRFAGQPDGAAALHLALADSRQGIGEPEAALAGYERAAALATEPALRLRAATGAALVLVDLGRDAEAQATLQAAASLLEPVRRVQPGAALLHEQETAALVRYGPQPAQSVQPLKALVPRIEGEFGARSHEAVRALTQLADAQMLAGALDDSLATFRDALARTEAMVGRGHARALLQEFGLAQVLRQADRGAESRALFRQAHERAEAALGEGHQLTIMLADGLAMSLPEEARQREGRALLERLLPLARQRFGADHPIVLTSTNNLAQIVGDGGDRRRERELYTELIASQRRVLGEQHLHTLISYHNLGRSHVRSQEFEQALAWTGLAHEGALKTLGESHPFVCTFGGMRATALAGAGRRDEARTLAAHCAERLKQQLGPEHASTRGVLDLLARL